MIFQVIVSLLCLFLYIYYSLSKNRNYWADRGVPNTGFKFFWGDSTNFFTGKTAFQEVPLNVYNRFPGERFVGCWKTLGKPYLMIRNDFDLIKSIWIKDFDHFVIANSNVKAHRKIWPGNRNEKLMLNNVQSASGDEWKDIRYQMKILIHDLH